MRLSFRLLNVIILIIFLPGIEVWAADFPGKTNPIIISPKSDLEQQIIKNIRKQTIEQAERLLSEKPVTVTASSCKRSTGGTNDFYSEGDYWWPVRQSCLLFAGLAYQNKQYISTFLSLPANPEHPEVIRNLPVRHPVIWMMRTPAKKQSKK